MDRSDINLAVRLLRKAESTDSDHESAALALRSYSLLASVINGFEEDAAEPRRRERRLLEDRRAARREAAPAGGRRHSTVSAAPSPATQLHQAGGATRLMTGRGGTVDGPAARSARGADRSTSAAPGRNADRRVAAYAKEAYERFTSIEPRGRVTELWL